jgi:hypothetical protein
MNPMELVSKILELWIESWNMNFNWKGKEMDFGFMTSCYIGPFPILEKCGTVAYKLELSSSLVGVHDIFHMS